MKTDINNHTPTPWKSLPTSGEYSLGQDDFAFILHCVNSHDALVRKNEDMMDALKQIIWKLQRQESKSGKGDDCQWAKIDIKDAVIKHAMAVVEEIEIESEGVK